MSKDDLKVPEGLSDLGKKAADAILATTKAESGGDCKAFYTPAEWEARGEKYGSGSELIVVHDGGDLAPSFNMDYYCYESVEEVRVRPGNLRSGTARASVGGDASLAVPAVQAGPPSWEVTVADRFKTHCPSGTSVLGLRER